MMGGPQAGATDTAAAIDTCVRGILADACVTGDERNEYRAWQDEIRLSPDIRADEW